MARRLDPTIKQQQILRKQLEGALQGEVLTVVRRATQGKRFEFTQRTEMAASSLQITEKTMPSLYSLCEGIKQELEFNENVEFYIQGNSEVNAYAYISEDKDKPHIIVINSALYNLMDEEELKFIFGHEIGHLVNQDSYINRLYSFIYPDEDEAPEIISARMNQYVQLAEYAADRYGYGACKNVDACITALYKLTCGIDLKKMGVSIDSLIDQNFDKADYLVNNGIISHSDHPDIPLRIHAMLLYARCKTIKELEENMGILFDSIPGMHHSEVDGQMALFVASAGIKLSTKDGKMEKTERDMIVEEIAKYEMEPSKILKIVQKGDVDTIYEQSLSSILDTDPSKVIDLFKYYIELSFADKSLQLSELEAIKEFGKKVGLDEDVMYETIADELRENYCSIADSL